MADVKVTGIVVAISNLKYVHWASARIQSALEEAHFVVSGITRDSNEGIVTVTVGERTDGAGIDNTRAIDEVKRLIRGALDTQLSAVRPGEHRRST